MEKNNCEAILKNSFGRGHGSVGDQACFIFSIENLPRLTTLQLCLPEFAAHLQQSLRRAKADRGFYLSSSIKQRARLRKDAENLLNDSFLLYEKMFAAGIAGEDARYILPIGAKTNIQTAINARELCHLYLMARKSSVPAITICVVREMMRLAIEKAPYLFKDFGANYEQLSFFPSSQLFAEANGTMNELLFKRAMEVDDSDAILLNSTGCDTISAATLLKAVKNKDEAELANLKHVHFEFLAKMSPACFHQATRQRTWNQSVESVYAAAREAYYTSSRMFVPDSIKRSSFADAYVEMHINMILLYEEAIAQGVSLAEAIGVVPHSLMIYDWIHVNGWNAIHAIGKRTCQEAQLEIRRIAWAMARQIKSVAPIFKGYVEPQCINYGKCPEKNPCGYFEKYMTKEKM